MRVGIPTEIKEDENRVAVTPAGVEALVEHGHGVFLEAGAGLGSRISDEAFAAAGATIVSSAGALYEVSDLILKVKEPLEREYGLLRRDHVLFTFLHLANSETLTRELLSREIVAIGYETVQLEDGSLPLLAPMSEVAGCLSIQVGARALEADAGGKGILLRGISGVRRGRVAVLGAGIAGFNACVAAAGLGLDITILDINARRLSYVRDVVQGHVNTLMSNRANLREAVRPADLVIGAVLIPGARAPKLLSRELLQQMESGSALVDVCVDQGGCAETTRPTTHHEPRYIEEGIVHYAVANMPGAVPQTSTYALTNATLNYALHLADRGWEAAAAEDPALARGVHCAHGALTQAAVAETFGIPVSPLSV